MLSRGWLQYYRARVSLAAAEFARYSVSCRHLGADATRANDLDALLQELRTAGVQVDPHRLAWIMDPDGNRIEPWEPPKGDPR